MFILKGTPAYNVSDIHKNPEHFDLATTYQVYYHTKSCRKYKNEKFRYHLGKFLQKRL